MPVGGAEKMAESRENLVSSRTHSIYTQYVQTKNEEPNTVCSIKGSTIQIRRFRFWQNSSWDEKQKKTNKPCNQKSQGVTTKIYDLRSGLDSNWDMAENWRYGLPP